MPKSSLDDLEKIQRKLITMIGVLGTAFGAEAQKRAEATASARGADDEKQGDEEPPILEFDTTRIMLNAAAKKFWLKHVGRSVFSVEWGRLVSAIKFEYKHLSKHAMFSETGFATLKASLDNSGNNTVSVYDFAQFTDAHGFLSTFQMLTDPSRLKLLQPESDTTDRNELLRRTVVVIGLHWTQIKTNSETKRMIEAFGPLVKYWHVFLNADFSDQRAGDLAHFDPSHDMETSGTALEFVSSAVALEFKQKADLKDAIVDGQIAAATKTVDELCDEAIQCQQKRIDRDRKVRKTAKEAKEQEIMEQALEAFKTRDKLEQDFSNNDEKLETKLMEISREEKKLLSELDDQKLSAEELTAERKRIHKMLDKRRSVLEEKWRKTKTRIEKKTQEVMRKTTWDKRILQIFTGALTTVTQDDMIGADTVTSDVEAQFRSQFEVSSDTKLIAFCKCGYKFSKWRRTIPGYVYLTDSAVYFHGSDLDGETTQIISLTTTTLKSIEAQQYFHKPTGILFQLRDYPVRLVDFSDRCRDALFELIGETWEAGIAMGYDKGGMKPLSRRGNMIVLTCGHSVIKQGWLLKQGTWVKNWKKRWVVLTNSELYYSPDRNTTRILKTIPMASVVQTHLVEPAPLTSGRFMGKCMFNLHTRKRTWHFVCDTRRLARQWVRALRKTQVRFQTANLYTFHFEVATFLRSRSHSEHGVLEIDLEHKRARLYGEVILKLRFDQIDSARPHQYDERQLHLNLKNHGVRTVDLFVPSNFHREMLLYVLGTIADKSYNAAVGTLTRLQREGASVAEKNVLNHLLEQFDVGDEGKVDVKALAKYLSSSGDKKENDQQLLTYLRQMSPKVLWRAAVRAIDSTTILGIARSYYLVLSQQGPNTDMFIYCHDGDPRPLYILNLQVGTLVDTSHDEPTTFHYFAALCKPHGFQFTSPEDFVTFKQHLRRALNLHGEDVYDETTQARDSRAQSVDDVKICAPGMRSVGKSIEVQARKSTISDGKPQARRRPGAVDTAATTTGNKMTTQPFEQRLHRAPKFTSPKEQAAKLRVLEEKARKFETLYKAENERRMELEEKHATASSELKHVRKDLTTKLRAQTARADVAESRATQLQSNLTGVQSKAETEMRAVGIALLQQGGLFQKHTSGRKPHPRFVCLSSDGKSILWHENAARTKGSKRIIVKDIKRVVVGHKTSAFKSKFAKVDSETRCFSLITDSRSLNLEAPDERTAQMWVTMVNNCVIQRTHSQHEESLRLPLDQITSFSRIGTEPPRIADAVDAKAPAWVTTPASKRTSIISSTHTSTGVAEHKGRIAPQSVQRTTSSGND